MVKICPNCGTKNSDDKFWCTKCQKRLLRKKGEKISYREKQAFEELSQDEFKNKGFKPKIITLIIIAIILLTVFLLVFEYQDNLIKESDKNDLENFIGTWGKYKLKSQRISFFKGNLCQYTNLSGKYYLRKGEVENNEPDEMLLILELQEGPTIKNYIFEYSFGKNKNKEETLKLKDITGENAYSTTYVRLE